MPIKHLPIVALTVFLWSAAVPLQAGSFDAATGNALIEKNQASLVEVHATLTVESSIVEKPAAIGDGMSLGPAQTKPTQAAGVVIHSNGLVALSLAELDPVSAMAGAMITVQTPVGKIKIANKSSLSALKILTADGREIPATVILQDSKSGLALVKPSTPLVEPLSPVVLTKELPLPTPFSRIFAMKRLNTAFGHAPTLRVVRTGVIIQSPTPMIDTAEQMTEPGAAAFDSEGRFSGIILVTAGNAAEGAQEACFAMLPVSEIRRLGAAEMP